MVRALASALAIAVAACGASSAQARCDDLLPDGPGTEPVRDITARDLARIRDIGEPIATGIATSPYAISPDGRRLAFVIARGDPATNRVCTALVAMPLDGREAPRLLDRGGALPVHAGTFRGLFIDTGFPEQITPIWSPDGSSIAYRKVVEGKVQLVRAATDGSGASVVTRSPTDIEDFAWLPDGKAIVYATRASRIEAERAIDREGEAGWRYDARVVPNISWRPNPWARDLPVSYLRVDLANDAQRAATAAEQAHVVVPPMPGYPYDGVATAETGAQAWTERVSRHPYAEHQLWVSDARGRRTACTLPGCTGRISRVFWAEGDRAILFLGRAGWRGEQTVLHRWQPGSNRLTTVLRTTDTLSGCIQTGRELICGRENATMPRRIVAIDVATGRDRLIYDPNPEFARLRLGRVQRLRFTTDRGLEAWGDLVLPPGYGGTSKLPLIVVSYHSRGFLRGGTGDEYPIHPLAAKGFAVLSFERPPSVAAVAPGITSWPEALAELQRDWNERRSVHSALMAGIDKAIATGAIDPDRVGITGLSDGASIVEFALVNSTRFKAAAMSTCCDDRLTSLVLGGEAWGGENRRSGYPLSVDNDREYWKPISLSVNARRITTPILFQLADREAGLALESYGALREANKPVEMRIYPDEYHNKVQPRHRLAVYTRNIDWFAFWLRNVEDPDPGKQDQYARWRALREPAGGSDPR
ncbi:Atxe2 family lasso peptide isopeptidase [Sphingomonas suaedae]|uniref:Atxe2 family lasso peptide isopeptidase n=1 Tax=Sphingomonas suaedae TaxID=2599297 RepID=A0A518RCG7_9SPHN|nr:Atxe2 family lasso peptide isopeptidase [Sphingomonas suaedae]QDX25156.1 Atxe2 family lasso peptide isopeptidase [Sphingomonas suaedae]